MKKVSINEKCKVNGTCHGDVAEKSYNTILDYLVFHLVCHKNHAHDQNSIVLSGKKTRTDSKYIYIN